MRTIKSQDGKMIVNAEKLAHISFYKKTYETRHDDFRVKILWGEDYVYEAVYSTEARALKVLDMLNEWLILDRYILVIKLNRFLKKSDYFEMDEIVNHYNYFQMPKDSKELDE